jgi:hypothetical protein
VALPAEPLNDCIVEEVCILHQVDRVVVGTLATVPLDLKSPLPAVPEHLEEGLQHVERGGFGRGRRVDDEFLPVVPCASIDVIGSSHTPSRTSRRVSSLLFIMSLRLTHQE